MYKRQKLRHIALYTIVGFIVCQISCSKGPDFFRSYGKTSTEFRLLEHFSGFTAGEKFRIYITEDTSKPESIQITYGSNVLKGIRTEINNGMLNITDRNNFNWMRSLDVFPLCTLNVHRLESIIAMGASRIECIDTLKNTGLDFQMLGVGAHVIKINAAKVSGSCANSGNVKFYGRGGLLTWSCENGGWIDATDMESSDAYIFHYTDRHCYINPNMVLKAYVYAKGNVYYFRQPVLDFVKEEFGAGKVIKK